MDGGFHATHIDVERAGRLVVRDVTLQVRPGAVTALLGPNGAGKSSLVLAMAGVLRPARGVLTLDGRDLTGRRPEQIRSAGLAVVPEGHRVLGNLSVADNLRVAGSRLPRARFAAQRDEVLKLFPEIEEFLGRPAGRLSGGQQQMVALAQAMMSAPKVLVVDELSLGLAPIVVRRLAPALEHIAETGVGVLLIEQFTSLALSIADRGYVLVRGQVCLEEQAATLRAQPELIAAAYRMGATGAPVTPGEPLREGTS